MWTRMYVGVGLIKVPGLCNPWLTAYLEVLIVQAVLSLMDWRCWSLARRRWSAGCRRSLVVQNNALG